MSSVCSDIWTVTPYIVVAIHWAPAILISFKGGLREGCPSSCMVHLMFHNAVLRDYVSHVDALGGSTVTFGNE